MKNNSKNHILMLVLLVLWTVDAVIISSAVDSINPFFLIFVKTLFSLPVLALTGFIFKQNMKLPKKEDIPSFAFCALTGEILYFYFEYSAYKYLPIGMVMVLIGMCPLISYIVDCMVRKERPKIKIVLLIITSIVGLGIAVLSEDNKTSFMGYVYCALAIAIWIIYGYAVKKIGNSYDVIPLTFYESCFSVIIMLPIAIFLRPQEPIGVNVIINIAVMGMIMNGFGFILENNGVITLGTTIAGLYVNMLPVLTSIAGFLFLNETMSIRQIVGSFIVVICGVAVILINGKKNDDESNLVGKELTKE